MPSHRSALAAGFDAVAEATVVPSFSRAGFALRRSMEHWEDPPSMAGQVAVVTGASSGIGLAAARAMAALGAAVHIVGRDAERGRRALEAVEAAGPGPGRLHVADMADLDQVGALATRLLETCGSVDALVHCAGALNRVYMKTAAGTELTVATHVLGPYLLTAKLAPLLAGGASSRIVTVSSGGMYTQGFDLTRLEMGPDGYDGVVAYARTKRAQVVLAGAWARRFSPAGVASYAMHPGWVDTPGLRSGMPGFRAFTRLALRSPSEGADTVVWLAAGGEAAGRRPGAAGGGDVAGSGIFLDRRRRRDRRLPVTGPTRPGDGEALISWCAARTGVETPIVP